MHARPVDPTTSGRLPGRFALAVIVTFVAAACGLGDRTIDWDAEQRVAGAIAPGAMLVIDPAGKPAMTTGWAPLRWPEDSTACQGTQVAVRARGDTAYALWWHRNAYGYGDLFFARSNDAVHWQPAVLLGGAVPSARICQRPPPALAVDSITGAVYIAWHGMTNLGPATLLAEAPTSGRAGSRAVILDKGDLVAMASVAARGDTVAVAFESRTEWGSEVRLALSVAKGHIPVVRGPVSPRDTRAFAPLVALREGRVAVAWNEGRRPGAPPSATARVGRILR